MKRNKNNSLFDPVLLRRSLRASFTKLDPRQMIKNPIMFTVEAVTFAMLLLIVRIAVTGDTSQGSLLYNLVIFAVLLLTSRATPSPPTARSSRAWRRSTKAPSRANRPR